MFKKYVEIEYEDYGTKAVDYYVGCFDRMLHILFTNVNDKDVEKIEQLLDDAYFKWNNAEDEDEWWTECCEECMINSLGDYKNNIVAVIYDRDEEDFDDEEEYF